MKSIIILCSFFFFLHFQNNSKNNTDINLDDLKGKVKQLKQDYYKAQNKFGELVQGEREDSPDDNFLNKYDSDGNRIEQNTYYSNGSLKYKFIYKYKYDDKKIELRSGVMMRIVVCYQKSSIIMIQKEIGLEELFINRMVL